MFKSGKFLGGNIFFFIDLFSGELMRGTWWSRLVHLSLSPPLVLEMRPPTDNSCFFPPGK